MADRHGHGCRGGSPDHHRRRSKSPNKCKHKECERQLAAAQQEVEQLQKQLQACRDEAEAARQCCETHKEELREQIEELQKQLEACKEEAELAKQHCEQEKDELREKIKELEEHQCSSREGRWVPAANGEVPPGAIVSGMDPSKPYYVARATMEGNLVPGKLTPSHQTCWVPYNKTEVRKNEYEVLVDADCRWLPMTSDEPIPKKAVAGGYMITDGVKDVLYIGRANIDIRLVPGYVFASTRELLHSNNYKNEMKQTFEILIQI